MGPDYELELLLYADDLEVLGMGAKGRQGIPMCYLLLASVGFPFKWAKTRGGFRVEWLGLETEYVGYKLGLSKKRADWLVGWLRAKVKDGYVGAVEMAQGLGRLGFAATALDWERPFLGPLHAWSSAVAGKSGKLTLPTMLRVLMEWLAERLGGRERLQQPESVVYHARRYPSSRMRRLKMDVPGLWGLLGASPWMFRTVVLARGETRVGALGFC